ncbi:MAG: ATP-binding cassette domain-containing protein [Bacillota bacterium]
MIKLDNVKKTYNKRKQNENRVLDGISLDLPEKGLVVLLGESGSGKTTLLNAMSGLDKVDSGAITFDQETFEKYDTLAWDKLRTKDIGYVFQNYYLLPFETVYNNIRLTLKMIGIENEAEIGERIDYLLSVVGMQGYKNRKANQLSGGQQQRIAIVRALAKDPKVIIADEPTGNLDSRNTLEVMQIIKQISKEKLVVMVTHETNLARSYGDEIIEIVDGNIQSRVTNHEKTQHTKTHETDIYLGDLDQVLDDDNVKVFMDASSDKPPKARLILKNKTLYIDIEDSAYNKVYMLDENSDVKIHDARREEVEKTEEALPPFNYSERFAPPKKSLKQVIGWKHALERAWGALRRTNKLTKLLFFGFFLGASVFALAVAMFTNIYFIDDEDFLETPKYTFTSPLNDAYSDTMEFDDFDEVRTYAESRDSVKAYGVAKNNSDVRISLPKFYQTGGNTTKSGHIAPIELVDESDLIAGSMPDGHGLLIDKALADSMIENGTFPNLGIDSYEALLSLDGTLQLGNSDVTYEIAGITDTDAPVYYASRSLRLSIDSDSFIGHTMFEDDLEVLAGNEPESAGEIMIHASTVNDPEAIDFTEETREISGITYDVVGVYDLEGRSIETTKNVALEDTIEALGFNDWASSVFFYTDDREAFKAEHDLSEGMLIDEYEQSYQDEETMRRRTSGGLMVFSIVTLVATAGAFYFIIRSSMMRRIYEIGVYRSLGVKRLDIIKIFLLEIVLMTSVSSVLGYLGMSYVLRELIQASGQLIDIFNVSFFTVAGGLLVIYLINSLFGLLPLFGLLRKTPAQIQSVYDL